ncbi:hypothetical protein PCYB_133770 [Plasmodium cynomolgi strain B]|uniref:Uncharacterized protein n=1 Tax=Plasmodium cynomolgi (strain B) TaxID=1120755 RepID=K6UMD4_PLACD|nr:hypothetical protein PCYB_133770 [Plasmodium cynomolgi strain B]GAB68503.1 hypothetical protein PCYB_133770 [Plasmodium cynomolgi strain B]
MDLDQVEERIKKLEENIAKFEEQELRNIENIKNEIKLLDTHREYSIKSMFEEISKIKNKAIAYFNKFLIIQKEIHSLLQSINNNALTDLFVLAQNSLLFQKEVANMFQRFYRQVENSLTGL